MSEEAYPVRKKLNGDQTMAALSSTASTPLLHQLLEGMLSLDLTSIQETSSEIRSYLSSLTNNASCRKKHRYPSPAVHARGDHSRQVTSSDMVSQLLTHSPHLASIPFSTNGRFSDLPLHVAARLGDLSLCRIVHAAYPTAASTPNKKGKLPLHVASRHGHIDIVRFLLTLHPNGAAHKTAKTKLPLHFAASAGHTEVCKLLLSAYPEGASRSSSGNVLPLHVASRNGHVDIVSMMMQRCSLEKAPPPTDDGAEEQAAAAASKPLDMTSDAVSALMGLSHRHSPPSDGINSREEEVAFLANATSGDHCRAAPSRREGVPYRIRDREMTMKRRRRLTGEAAADGSLPLLRAGHKTTGGSYAGAAAVRQHKVAPFEGDGEGDRKDIMDPFDVAQQQQQQQLPSASLRYLQEQASHVHWSHNSPYIRHVVAAADGDPYAAAPPPPFALVPPTHARDLAAYRAAAASARSSSLMDIVPELSGGHESAGAQHRNLSSYFSAFIPPSAFPPRQAQHEQLWASDHLESQRTGTTTHPWDGKDNPSRQWRGGGVNSSLHSSSPHESIHLPPPTTVVVPDENGVPRRCTLMYGIVSMSRESAIRYLSSLAAGTDSMMNIHERVDGRTSL